jgi:hypothetical protein
MAKRPRRLPARGLFCVVMTSEHVPEKCSHFSDKNMLQTFESEYFLYGEVRTLRLKIL